MRRNKIEQPAFTIILAPRFSASRPPPLPRLLALISVWLANGPGMILVLSVGRFKLASSVVIVVSLSVAGSYIHLGRHLLPRI